jgi:hypothetical protein
MGRRSRLRPRVSAHAAGLGAKSRAPADRATRMVHYLCRVSPHNSESNLPSTSVVQASRARSSGRGDSDLEWQSRSRPSHVGIGLSKDWSSEHTQFIFVSQRYPGHKAGAVSQRTRPAGTFMILKRQPCNLCNI